ncbi:MAG TPA: head GIN domain-containing protein [Saprospiraceae bacterium]|nr:head GIN domain-containing protein [Saprospiraceae bacterium]
MTTKLKIFMFPLLAFCAIGSSSCFFDFDDDDDIFGCEHGSGSTVSRDLQLDDFHSVTLEISGDVYVRQGNDFSVTAEGQENILDLLDTDVHNGVWEIDFTDCVSNFRNLKIFITMPEVRALTATASGDIRSENVLEADDLVLLATGSGNIILDLDANNVEATSTGSGDIRLDGFCDNLNVVLTGSGDFEGFSLKAGNADVRTTGSGDAEVNVEDNLTVRITGSGDVSYKGNPSISSTITGSGRLINAN